MSEQTTAPENQPAPPLFYKRPVPLRGTVHTDFKVRPDNHFEFAAGVNSLPISTPEFVLASRHYPIIFIGDEKPVPLAVVGINPDTNLYIDEDGYWEVGQYVPAYVRRYPFILLNDGGPDGKAGLGIDEEGGVSTHPDARVLFPNGEAVDQENPPEVIKEALGLCEQFHGAFLQTEQVIAHIHEAGVLEDRSLGIRDDDGKERDIGQFKAINEDKFKELPDATINEWRKNGALSAAYFHLASLNNWDNIFFRAQMREQNKKITIVDA